MVASLNGKPMKGGKRGPERMGKQQGKRKITRKKKFGKINNTEMKNNI